ncbi:MAG: AbrB family transcriptional regulator, partial [Roseovarius sp.]|nr:AbrB family transcriptional regulator [Roseovarius sp.]
PDGLRDLAFATIGVSLGSGVSEEVLDQIGTWGISLSILIVSLIVTVLAGRLLLTRIFGLDAQTATLASSPGTMSNAVAIAAEGTGDATAVMFLQLMRVLALVILVPPLAVALEPAEAAPALLQAQMNLPALIGLLVTAMLLGMVGRRLGLPAASLLSGMVISSAAHAGGVVQGATPAWVIFAAFALTGAVLGSRMSRVTLSQISRYAFAGLSTVATAMIVSLIFALLAVELTTLPFSQIWIAYAPGGVEAMAAIGLSLGVDPAYVAVHHFVRIFALIFIVPITLKL